MVMVADAFGGYMYGVLLVKVKASYYEGRVSFDVTNTLYGIMRKIKYVNPILIHPIYVNIITHIG
jgi:hypothetical protein